MDVRRRFTDGADSYAVRLEDSHHLYFLGGDDRLLTEAGTTTAFMGDGDDYVRIVGGLATIRGEKGADRFYIASDDSTVNGGDDDDIFDIAGGSGSLLAGSFGNDRFSFRAATNDVLLRGGDGEDLFIGNSQAISGRILGGAGRDRFLDFGNHEGRSLILLGGVGDDLYRLDAGSPARVAERAGEGVDTIQVARGTSYTLAANVENLTVFAGAARSGTGTLTGNELSNRITGSGDDEVLKGLGGDDVLIGNRGVDVMHGGAGNDRIHGGGGYDHIETGPGRDIIAYTSVADSPNIPQNFDTDWIADWDQMDRIDLSAIDANSEVAGNQEFRFAGYSFGMPPGERPAGSLVIGGFGGELYISLYIDGDGLPDMIIGLWSQAGEAGLTPDYIVM